MSFSRIETEAKFIIPNFSTFLALQKLTCLADFELKPLGTKVVVDRYLDTSDRRLYQAGWACRFRSSQSRHLLTLKSLTPAQGHTHHRQEIETEVESGQLPADQPQHWAESEVKKLVIELAGSAPLQTLFTLFQTRHQFHSLWQGQPVLEFSLDEVSWRDPTVVDYREAEAELIEPGVAAHLDLFVEALQACWPLQAEAQSKFERALAATNQKADPTGRLYGHKHP